LQSILAEGDHIDRLELFIAPKLLGDGIPMIKIPPRLMPEPAGFVSHTWSPQGPDMRFTGIIKKY
jgi:riboflavin biosynthesis pyrimidine reductase